MSSFLSLFLAAAAPLQPDSLDQGAAYWQQGEFARATAIWSSPARANDPDALYNLGQAYRLGKGVARDPAMAIAYYRRADKAGHPKAAEQLGLMLFGDEMTRTEALDLLERAARQGAPRAGYVMALEHLDGKRVRRDIETARTYLERAAAAGVPGAAATLANLPRSAPAKLAPIAATALNVSIAPARSTQTTPLPKQSASPGPQLAAAPRIVSTAGTPSQSGSATWVLVLGQYRSMTSAAVKWLKISARANLRNQNASFEQVPTGVVLSLRHFDEPSARSLCADLSAHKISCTVESRDTLLSFKR